MATKVFEFDLWTARDEDKCIFSYLNEPKNMIQHMMNRKKNIKKNVFN